LLTNITIFQADQHENDGEKWHGVSPAAELHFFGIEIAGLPEKDGPAIPLLDLGAAALVKDPHVGEPADR